MRPPDVVFADNGARMVRRYGATAGEQSQTWRGMCVESRSPAGTSAEHVFADGTELLRDPPVRLSNAVAGQARAVLGEPARPAAPPPEADQALNRLTRHHQVTVTWASVRQHVAVGDGDRLVTDERALCTVEVAVPGIPGCSEVVRWDAGEPAASLQRVMAAAELVRALAALPSAGPVTGCDVVLEPGRAGPFFHELLGHPLEADIVAARASYLSDRSGETVAPAWLTVTDGPPGDGQAGDGLAASIDDEGTPTGTVELISGGRVSGVLSDRLTAALAGTRATGHGRRLDYRHPVVPRMWHTVAWAAAAPAEPPGAARFAPRALQLRRMNLLTGDFEFVVPAASLDAGTGPPRRTGPCAVTGNALTVLAALGPGEAGIRPGGRAWRGCGKLGQFPLVTTFANGGLWIPAEAVHVRSDPAA
jgi:TldD protein